MRPISLEITAFGPFLATQKLNFSFLTEEGLFAITGPTGSGKTTIFDAITFALYGKTSGSNREASNLRSDFAEGNETCEVIFQFKLHGEIYQIERIPKQTRMGRGNKLVGVSPSSHLTMPDGTLISGADATVKKITELLGLSYAQFCQIVLLPQGEFNRFLFSKSGEKQQIFSTLFSTDLFKSVEDTLKKESKTLTDSLYRYTVEQQSQISLLRPKSDTLIEILNSENYHVEDLIPVLDEQNSLDQGKEKELSETLMQKQRAIESLNIQGVKEFNEKILEKENLSARLFSLKEQLPNIMNLEKQFDAAKRAEIVRPKKEYLDHSLLEVNSLKTRLAELSGNEEQAKLSLKTAQEKLKNSQKESAKKLEFYQSIGKIDQTLLQLQKKMELQKKSTEKKHLKNEIERQLEGAFLLEHRAVEYEKYQNSKEEYQRILDSISATTTYLERKANASEKMALYDQATIDFLNGQAGVIASHLSPATPCPVCGSIEHPNLAIPLPNTPTEIELEQKKRDYQKAEQKSHHSREIWLKLLSTIPTIDENIEELAILKSLSAMKKESFKSVEINRLSWEESNIVCINRSNNKKKLEESLFYDKNWIQEQIKKHQTLMEKNRLEIETLDSQIKDLENSFSKDINMESLNVEKKDLETRLQKIEVKEKESLNYFQEILSKSERLSGEISRVKEEIRLKEKTQEELKKQLADLLQNEGFDSLEIFTNSMLPMEKIEELSKNISQYYLDKSQIETRMDFLTQEIGDKKIADIYLLEKEFQRISNELVEVKKQLQSIRVDLEINLSIKKELSKISKQKKQKEDVRNTVQYLSNLANGTAGSRISFERYVLSQYFSEIIHAANYRLLPMTGGRYKLFSSQEKEKAGAMSGLSIEVFDSYTGKKRSVTTLSGGESFQVSLALSLGLSDVVQNESGGIQIETLFIDEGFGSLDQEAMDNALSALQHLKNDGRFIGVISHIEELKERIPCHLEILPSRTGSHAKFIVP